jgi:NAD(P)-dependent dehydrogenase (short-subunit alcohol dehydrogenase family)
VAACARSKDKLDEVVREINDSLEKQQQQQRGSPVPARGFVRAFGMDSSQEASVNAAFAAIRKELGSESGGGGGRINVLVYNAAQRKFRSEDVLQVDPAVVERFWRVNCFGALLCARQALPDMLATTTTKGSAPASEEEALASLHKGTMIFTGASASLRCLAGYTSMSIGKFGLRALAQGLAREFGPKGVHVAHVVVDGAVDSPLLRSYVRKQLAKPDRAESKVPTPKEQVPFAARFLQPAAVAHEYFRIHRQHPSTWTQELDLRPHVEPIMSRM